MRKSLFFVLVWLSLACGVWAQQSTMSDQQVIEFVEVGIAQGKSQQQIAAELSRRGVTREQAERVKQLYQQQEKNGKGKKNEEKKSFRRRDEKEEAELMTNDFDFEKDNSSKSKVYKFVTNQKLEEGNTLTLTLDKDGNLVSKEATLFKEAVREDDVFGRNIFNSKNLTFEPNQNMATPVNYRLGPGDEVIVDIWGDSQTTIRETISPEGTINIQSLGLVSLNGLTIVEASNYLRKELDKIYSGVDGPQGTTQMKVTLGNTRTIQVNVMGEVFQPGTYSLSSFSSVFHALYSAGGVSEIGSLRHIQVMRNGKKVAEVDVYAFMMEGRTNDDISLQEGDVIVVPPYDALVKLEGKVKRPMKYEMKTGETVAKLLQYAGTFSSDAYQRSIRLIRQNGREYQVNTIDDIDFSVFKLKDGDVLTAESILDRYENKLEIKGAVYRPGVYQLSGSLNTVKQLVEKADGVLGDAFMGRAVLHRQREDLTREVKQVDIKGILVGTTPDIPLQKNDVLYIPSIHDLKDLGKVEVFGEVARPGTFVYADNTTLEDIIIQAGGLLESASTVRVDVSRRIKNEKATTVQPTIGEMYSFSLKDGFVVDGTPGFVLQPYDQVYVRKSPGYQAQANVKVNGEILYDGTYALTTKSERLSDLVKKAGGVTDYAYVRGAKLIRKATQEDLDRMADVQEMMRRELGDSKMDSLKLDLDSIFTVGIDLELALIKPGSDADIVLREGDELVIPELVNTVKVNGAVMMPNTVSYKEGESVKYYLSQAGGFSNSARRSKAFIIYMNGQVAKVKGSGKKQIEPGCEIIVPVRNKNSKWNMQSIIGIASSLGSLGLTAASIANILK